MSNPNQPQGPADAGPTRPAQGPGRKLPPRSEQGLLSKTWYGIKRRVLGVFGDIKVFGWPMFIVYHPNTFYIKGEDTQTIMSLVEPGDLLLRKYTYYLDGYFIPGSYYSHGGIYVGDAQMIHSVAEGVQRLSIIDFVRADAVAVLRPRVSTEVKQRAVERARELVAQRIEYDFNFDSRDRNLYCFELCALCYDELDIEPISRRKFGIQTPRVYLDDSFLHNPTFDLVYEKRYRQAPVIHTPASEPTE